MRDLTHYKKIFIAGHRGMVGSAIVRQLKHRGLGSALLTRSRKALDLTQQQQVENFFATEKPDCVFFTAAKAGGIQSNMAYPAEYIYENMSMGFNVIHSAKIHGVKLFVNIGSSCVYPKNGEQPFRESSIFDGNYETTHEYYALAKAAIIKMGEAYKKQYNLDFISVVPCNIFGINDHFDSQKSHVVAGLITRFHQAKQHNTPQVIVWGTGNARRELLFSEDAGRGIVTMAEYADSGEVLNLGMPEDISIHDLAYTIADIVGYKGKIVWDTTKPEGIMQKKVCINKQNKIGFNPAYDIKTALQLTYAHYTEKQETTK